jgi:hypothetical protein
MSRKTVDLSKIDIDMKTFQKMIFIYNSIEDGWNIQKKGDQYIFLKSHEGKKDVYTDEYLDKFIEKNFDVSLITPSQKKD